MHSIMAVVLGPLARVSQFLCEGSLCWGSVLQGFPCLFKIDFWVAWGHGCCPQIVQVVEHRVIIDVIVGVDDSSISRVVEILQCFAKPAVLLDYSLEVR
jgi:hypothetical protein